MPEFREPQGALGRVDTWLQGVSEWFLDQIRPAAAYVGLKPQSLLVAGALFVLLWVVLRRILRGKPLRKRLAEHERIAAEERRMLAERVAKLEAALIAMREGAALVGNHDGAGRVGLKRRAERAEEKVRRMTECLDGDPDGEEAPNGDSPA